MVKALRVAGRRIGPGHPCFVIGEAGVNHDGRERRALQLVDAGARAGVDAVKFQTFRAEALAASTAPQAAYQRRNSGRAESQLAMLRRLELDAGQHRRLKERCRRRGVVFLSTPFEEESADFLERLGVPAFKVPSGELTNLPFLRHLARKRLPLIVSTGMATLDEVGAAVEAVRSAGNRDLVLLQCVSNYPADPRDVNLRAMATLSKTFRALVGYSDHTLGNEVALAAVALGACVLEKHFTLDRTLPGPDHKASLEPAELAALVRGVRTVESSLGNGLKAPARSERATALVARKSLAAAVDLPKGTRLREDVLCRLRPGSGFAPSRLRELIGRRLRRDVPQGALLREADLEDRA